MTYKRRFAGTLAASALGMVMLIVAAVTSAPANAASTTRCAAVEETYPRCIKEPVGNQGEYICLNQCVIPFLCCTIFEQCEE